MIIRPVTMADVPTLLQLEKSLYKTPWSEKMLVDEVANNKFALMFVLCEKEIILGYYGMWIVNDYSTITKVSIRKELQGKGLSKILMEDLFKRCEQQDVVVIDLEVRPSNVAARALYTNCGFTEVGVRKGYYSDGEDAIAMVKNLKEGEHYEKIHLGN